MDDVRRDVGAPKMPFVIGVMGVGGPNADKDTQEFRKAMAAPAALSRRVAAAGGSLVVTGTPRTGVRVLATLPVAAGASGGETRT